MSKQKSENGEPKAKRERKAKSVVEEVATEQSTPEVAIVAEIINPSIEEVSVDTIQFVLAGAEKSGQGRYRNEGYRGTVYLSKTMFPGGVLPEAIDVVNVGFAAPGEHVSAKPKKVLTPEEQAKKDARAAKKAEREANVEVLAAKLTERLAKLTAKLEKAKAKIPAPAVEM